MWFTRFWKINLYKLFQWSFDKLIIGHKQSATIIVILGCLFLGIFHYSVSRSLPLPVLFHEWHTTSYKPWLLKIVLLWETQHPRCVWLTSQHKFCKILAWLCVSVYSHDCHTEHFMEKTNRISKFTRDKSAVLLLTNETFDNFET